MLPAQVMLSVMLAGVDDPNHPAAVETNKLLIDAADEPVKGLHPQERSKIIRRMFRVHQEVTEPYRKQNARVDKMGLIAFYWLKALTDSEFLVMYEGSAMGKAMELMLPALEHAAAQDALDSSAQKAARKFLAHLQELGYYAGVEMAG